MKKAIVTGGSGFIGSHISEELVKRDYQVIIIDNLSTGRISNISSLINNSNVEFVQGSITNLSLMRKISSDVDYIFHQAAIPSVPRSIKKPKASHNANITGTLNVLIAAKDNGVKKVVYASSSSVYGDTPTLPKVENMTPEPLSPYAVTKLAGEYYCNVFNNIYKLNTVCLRYFNVYGPRQDPNSPYAAVIPLFINNVLAGKPPVIFGDGEQSRDFTYIRDVVEANMLAAESNAIGSFNIGRSKKITLNTVASLVIRFMGKDGMRPVYMAPRPGDILHSLADISKAITFGYNPKFSLETGLKETIQSFIQGMSE